MRDRSFRRHNRVSAAGVPAALAIGVTGVALAGSTPPSISAAGVLQDDDATKRFVTGPGETLAAGRPAVGLSIPPRVLAGEIITWSSVLGLSESQQLFFEHLHAEYLPADAERRRELLAPLWVRSADLASRITELLTNMDVAEERQSLMEDTRDAVMRIADAEQQELFGQLEATLTTQQLPALERIRQRRLRAVYLTVGTTIPGADVDLSELVLTLREKQQFAETNEHAFDELLAMYEHTLTEQHRRRYDSAYALRGRGSVHRAREFQAGTLFDTPGHYARLAARAARAQQAIADLHELYLPILAAHLTDESARRLTELYRRSAYPQVYPNPYDLRNVFESALALDGLSDTQREDVSGLMELADDRQTMICKRMNEEISDWLAAFVASFTMDATASDAHRERLDSLHQERRLAAEEIAGILLNVLDGEDRTRISAMLDEFWRVAMALKPDGDRLRYYPAGRGSAGDL